MYITTLFDQVQVYNYKMRGAFLSDLHNSMYFLIEDDRQYNFLFICPTAVSHH